MLLSSRHDCTVNRLSFFIRRNGFESASFRLTFYSVENGLPKDILGDKDIRFDLPDGYTGWVDLDLSECPVHVKAGDFAVTMTFLDGKQGDSAFRGLEFPVTRRAFLEIYVGGPGPRAGSMEQGGNGHNSFHGSDRLSRLISISEQFHAMPSRAVTVVS